MRRVNLLSYKDAFLEGKLRPGFKVEGTLYVLTSTKPRHPYIRLPNNRSTGHFQTNKSIYLTKATNQNAQRFNNIIGGHLDIDETLFEESFDLSLLDYSLKISNSMTNFEVFTIHGEILTINPELFSALAERLGKTPQELLAELKLPASVKKNSADGPITVTDPQQIVEATAGWWQLIHEKKATAPIEKIANEHQVSVAGLVRDEMSTYLPEVLEISPEDVAILRGMDSTVDEVKTLLGFIQAGDLEGLGTAIGYPVKTQQADEPAAIDAEELQNVIAENQVATAQKDDITVGEEQTPTTEDPEPAGEEPSQQNAVQVRTFVSPEVLDAFQGTLDSATKRLDKAAARFQEDVGEVKEDIARLGNALKALTPAPTQIEDAITVD